MTGKLPINIDHLLRQRTIEDERIEYKAGWSPQSVLHTICAFANDFHNLAGERHLPSLIRGAGAG